MMCDHSDGWALVLPVVDEPIVRVLAEASTAAAPDAPVDEYARRVDQAARTPDEIRGRASDEIRGRASDSLRYGP